MKKYFFAFILFFPLVSFAFTEPGSMFNVDHSTKRLERWNKIFTTQKLSAAYLSKTIQYLIKLQREAKLCVTYSQNNLDEISSLQKEFFPEAGESEAEIVDTEKYLRDQKSEFSKKALDCRLFVLRSSDLMADMSVEIQKLSAIKLVEVHISFWEKISASKNVFSEVMKNFDSKIFIEKSGIINFSIFSLIILLISISIIGFLSILLRRILPEKIFSIGLKTCQNTICFVLISSIKKYILWFAVPIVFCINVFVLDFLNNTLTGLTLVSGMYIVCVLFMMFSYFFFYSFDLNKTISGISVVIAKALLLRLRILTWLYFVLFVIYLILYGQSLSDPTISFLRSIFITLLSISLINILWLVNRIRVLRQHLLLCLTISLILTTVLSAIIVIEWLGYHALVEYVLIGIFLTLVFGFVAGLVHRISKIVLRSSAEVRASWYENLQSRLGLEQQEGILEFALLRLIFYILIWGSFTLILLKIWRVQEAYFRILIDLFVNGFSLYGLKVIPSRIFLSLFFIVFSLLIIRFIKTSFERLENLKMGKGAQLAVATIINYILILVIFVFALIIAGVNIAGFAIVAGALSVGIGFGLQNMVSNFVSGIILLVERPIKPGDRINIDGEEGYVRKVSIRATHIRTLAQSDLIVPNSEIISKKLTNLTYRGTSARIFIPIRVVYGSDIELVKKIFLDTAFAHPEVISDKPSLEPIVFFAEFGENSLNFECYCFVPHIDIRYRVLSDLHFRLEKAFRENNIKIALPRREMHITDSKND